VQILPTAARNAPSRPSQITDAATIAATNLKSKTTTRCQCKTTTATTAPTRIPAISNTWHDAEQKQEDKGDKEVGKAKSKKQQGEQKLLAGHRQGHARGCFESGSHLASMQVEQLEALANEDAERGQGGETAGHEPLRHALGTATA
jgi:hypothetical protein